MHPFVILLISMILLPAFDAASGAPLDDAKKLFERYIDSERTFDPAVADMYSDDAKIQNTRTYPDGSTRVSTMPAPTYRQLIRQAMSLAKERGDTNTYSEVKYTTEGDRIRITANRFSNLKKYSSPVSLLVGATPEGKWLIYEELSESRALPQEANPPAPLDFITSAKKYAKENNGKFRIATTDDLEALKKLKLPPVIDQFYRTHSPAETIYGFVNLLPLSEMVNDNLGQAGPGRDVFPLGFVVFASMDGDGFCIDVKSDPHRVILFGHEEPLEGFTMETREELIKEKGKVVAANLAEFFKKCLDETLDR